MCLVNRNVNCFLLYRYGLGSGMGRKVETSRLQRIWVNPEFLAFGREALALGFTLRLHLNPVPRL